MARKFCVLTVGRAGSTSLMESLEKIPGLAVPRTNVESEDNELVHPRHVKRHAGEYGKLVKRKISTQPELIDAFYEVNDSAEYAGFKSMPNRHRDFAAFASRKDIQFITLQRRDLASTAASFHRANETGTWRRHGEPRPDTWTFDVPRDGERVKENVRYILQSQRLLDAIPGAIRLFYEDLCDPKYASKELDAFFGRPVRLLDPKPATSGRSYVTNWEDFQRFVTAAAKQVAATKGAPEPAAAAPGRGAARPRGAASGARAQAQAVRRRSAASGRVFYAWELGMDLGHLLRFLNPALQLRERGHEVVFAVRDLSNAESTLGHRGFPLMQAPIWIANVTGLPKVTISYAEIALRYGFISYPGLKALVKAWRELFRYVRPGLVLTDHSPTALLAARSLGLRHAPIGSGFFNPPLTNPLPSMRYWDKVPAERIAQPDQAATQIANRVLADLGGAPLKSMADLFRADENFLCTFPELDHYPNRGKAQYWGPTFEMEQGVEPKWPEGEGKRIFAYIKPRYRDFEDLLKALRDSDARVLAFAPGISKEHLEKYASKRMVISREPLKLKAMIRDCDLVLCHGGPGTVTAALLAGVPLLIMPTQLEQLMSSRRVAQQNAAIVVMKAKPTGGKENPAAGEPPAEGKEAEKPTDYGRLIKQLLTDEKYRAGARAFAKKYERFSQAGQSRAIASRVEQLLQS
jgi:UDP:flavonoid glycosyltransferase YjiC (YdhE family)